MINDNYINLVIKFDPLHGDWNWLEEISINNDLMIRSGLTNIKILGVLMKFPGCRWNNDFWDTRNEQIPIEEVWKIRKRLDRMGFVSFISFDKNNLTSRQMKNEYCREMLKVFTRSMEPNYVYTESKKIITYIRRRCIKLFTFYSIKNMLNYEAFVISKNLDICYVYREGILYNDYNSIVKRVYNDLYSPIYTRANYIEPILEI